MAARIVYTGDLVGGGELFAGTTFHVLQRVPTRPSIIQQIEMNGGEITPIEKDADVVIADCARKGQPPGSISWKYIEQSVKKGELLNMEDFPANKEARQRIVGGSAAPASNSSSRLTQPKRTGRTPFTHEDDRILMEFCARKERQGALLKGNVIFLELESLNPRHTYQSWRDRWVKKLQDKPRPTFEELEGDEQENEVPDPPARSKASKAPKPPRSTKQPPPEEKISKTPTSKPTPKNIKIDSRNIIRRSSTTPVASARDPQTNNVEDVRPYVGVSAGGNKFTIEETQQLLDMHDDLLNLDEDAIIDAWIAWAVENPNHTAQEWRNHFNKEVKGRKKKPTPAKRELSPQNPPTGLFLSTQKVENGKRKANEDHVELVPIVREVKDSQGSSYRTIQSSESTKGITSSNLTDEEIFKKNLLSMAEVLLPEQFEKGIDFNPMICDIYIPLFEIWQAVMSDDFDGPTEINKQNQWPSVARKLGFLKPLRENAGRDLKHSCNDLLGDFELSLESFNEVTDEQANEMLNHQLQQTAIEAAQWSQPSENHVEQVELENEEDEDGEDLDAPQSSPFAGVSKKRMHSNTTTPARKRQKLDKGKGRAGSAEIPPTPEIVTSSYRRRSPMKPSPLKESLFLREEEQSEEGEEPEEDVEDSFTPSRKKDTRLQSTHQNSRSTPNRTQAGSPTQSQAISQKGQSLEEFIESRVALGYDEDFVLQALHTTSMATGHIATDVMESLKQGKGIPQNEPGVWTEKEDKVLRKYQEDRSGKHIQQKFAQLVLKHGKRSVKERKKFFKNMEDDD